MRVFNRLLAFVVALALLATSVIIIVEVIAVGTDSGPWIIDWHAILRWAQRNTWKATSVELASAITAAFGLLILIPQLIPRRTGRPGRPGRLRIHSPDVDAPDTDAALTRKGLTVTVQSAVESVEGITRSRVKVTHQRITVSAQAVGVQPEAADELTPLVRQAAQDRVEELGLVPAHRLRVAVIARRSGVQ